MRDYLKQNYIALILIFLMTLIPVFKYWDTFSTPTDIDHYEQLYANSQYVLGEASPHKIDDSEVYIYAGYTYIRGDDPTAVNFEHTPLAKYFLGLSYLVTGNAVLFNIPLYFTTLLLLYILSSKLIKNKKIVYLILLTVGTMKLVYLNVAQGMLDIPSLFATLLFFTILLTETKRKCLKYIALGVSLGIFAGIRYPFPVILLLIVPLLFWGYFKNELRKTLLSFLFLAITYLATYTVYFINHSILEYPRFEWYRFTWFAVDRNQPLGLIFQTIFLGKFMGWWNNQWQIVATWAITWPILFIGSLVATVKNKFNLENLVILMYTFGLIVFYIIAAASYDRFLIPIIPYWAIVMGIGIDNITNKGNIFSDFFKSLKKVKKISDFKKILK